MATLQIVFENGIAKRNVLKGKKRSKLLWLRGRNVEVWDILTHIIKRSLVFWICLLKKIFKYKKIKIVFKRKFG